MLQAISEAVAEAIAEALAVALAFIEDNVATAESESISVAMDVSAFPPEQGSMAEVPSAPAPGPQVGG